MPESKEHYLVKRYWYEAFSIKGYETEMESGPSGSGLTFDVYAVEPEGDLIYGVEVGTMNNGITKIFESLKYVDSLIWASKDEHQFISFGITPKWISTYGSESDTVILEHEEPRILEPDEIGVLDSPIREVLRFERYPDDID